MQYVYLPLDDRPCTYSFPVQLANAAGVDVCVPCDLPGKDYKSAYPYAQAEAFLRAHAGNQACIILAVDQLCYGGLLQSRSMSGTDQDTALARLKLIRELKKQYPAMQVHAFSVIMRASISTLSQNDLVHYNNMTLYCQLAHKARLTGSQEDREALERVTAQLPKELLAHYLTVRRRNHAVNCACVEMARDGIFDSLMLLQEDAQEYGLHRLEQERLLQCAQGCENVYLHNGADEGGVMALLCAVAREKKLCLKAAVCYLRGDEGTFVARYEDRPFCENLKSYLAYAGIDVVPVSEAQQVLCILSPDETGQKDMTDDVRETDSEEKRRQFAVQMAQLAAQGKHCYLLDLTVANGGLPGILQSIDDVMGLDKLWGYSAWNTTCNALGTIVAQMLSDALSGVRNECFLWERILDDCLYEGVVRARLRRYLTALGEDAMALQDKQGGEAALQKLAGEAMDEFPLFRRMSLEATLSLPWPRVFECRAECRKRV